MSCRQQTPPRGPHPSRGRRRTAELAGWYYL